MRNPHFALAVLFAITIAVFPGHAQDSSKEAAVKPPEGPAKVVLEAWNDIGRKLIAMAGLPRGQIRLQAHPRPTLFRRAIAARGQRQLFFQRSRHGQEDARRRGPQARRFQDQG